jgi:hypothetical protein
VDLGDIQLGVRELAGADVSRVGLVIARRPAPPAGGAAKKP